MQDLDAVRIACLRGGEQQVVAQTAGEYGGVLLHVADLGAQRDAVDSADVDPAQADGARVRVVEPLDEREDRALPGARGPDQGGTRSARDGEAHAMQDRLADYLRVSGAGAIDRVDGLLARRPGRCVGWVIRVLRVLGEGVVAETHVLEFDRGSVGERAGAGGRCTQRGDRPIRVALARAVQGPPGCAPAPPGPD